jgi:hypothetical protein
MQLQENYKSQKKAEVIKQRFQAKKKQQEQANEQLKSILLPGILNLSNYLQLNKLNVFSDWLLLNQACIEELEGTGLRDLAKNKNNPVFKQLSKSFKEAFLTMTA